MYIIDIVVLFSKAILFRQNSNFNHTCCNNFVSYTALAIEAVVFFISLFTISRLMFDRSFNSFGS